MSTQPISGASGAGGLQITGLASGLDTNAIITELMSIAQQPVTDLTNQQNGIQALDTQLTLIQSSLSTVALNAQALSDPTLFQTSQTVTSSNPSLIGATTGTGAGIGGYQVGVSQLANSAQRTFTFTSPGAPDTITIDGHATSVAAGSTVDQFVAAINSDANATVYAAKLDSGTVVLSNRSTGDTGTNFIQVSDPGGTLAEQTAHAKQGRDAQYTVDGVSGTSHSNTLTAAIAGVTLTLNGVTAAPVTVTVAAPAPSTSDIESALTAFVQSYNSAIDTINAQITQKPVSGQIGTGELFGDNELEGLLDDMRQTMYTAGPGLPTGMASLADVGVSTGAAVGSGALSQDALSGKLTINSSALEAAIASNPQGVQQMLQSWSSRFSQLVNNAAGPGGSIDARLSGNQSEISDMGRQIDNLNEMISNRRDALTQQFAALEASLSQLQAQGNWLSGQVSALTANSPVG